MLGGHGIGVESRRCFSGQVPLLGGWRRNFQSGLDELDCCTPNIAPRSDSRSISDCPLGKIRYSRDGKKNELQDDRFTLLRSIPTLLGGCS
jgi:hypothetical protein